MRKKYIQPEMVVEKLEALEIITTSLTGWQEDGDRGSDDGDLDA